MTSFDLRNLPLAALRAFESAGRHLHLGRAGEELGVTHSAISHQIRNLETALKVPLFDRAQNRLRLTASGQQLHRTVTEGFDLILSGARDLTADELTGPLIIGCTQTIGACWALKLICEFQTQYPRIDVAVRDIAPRQLTIPSEIDVAICYGAPDQQTRRIFPFASPSLYPVCSPRLASQHQRITEPSHLATIRLLDDGQNSWRRWFEATGAHFPEDVTIFHVDSTYLALTAARAGFGVALCNTLETAEDFFDGTLLRIIDAPLAEAERYYLTTGKTEVQSPRSKLFENWLLEKLAEAFPE